MVTKFLKAGVKKTIFTMCLSFCLLSPAIFAEDGAKKESLKELEVVAEIIKNSTDANKNNKGKDTGTDTKEVFLENTIKTNNVTNVSVEGIGIGNTTSQQVSQTIPSVNPVSKDHVANAGDIDTAKNSKFTKEKVVKKSKTTKAIDGVIEKSFADNEQINVVLSNRDINRVLVKGDKIQSVNGPTGLYMAKNDALGSAYISTYGESTFTVFVSTSKGHNFSLLVMPRATPGRTIILEPTTPSLLTARFEETESYQKVLVTFIKAMINNEMGEDYTYEEEKSKKSKKIDFYGVADIKQIASYSGSHLLGIVSEIKNKTKNPITLKPSYFYQPGVRAVALSNQTIAPSAVGLLYQVISRD
jgi:conjugal transfer pilus assembly protein TraK